MTGQNGLLSPRLELSFLLAAGGMTFCLTVLPPALACLRPVIPFWLFLLLSTVPVQLSGILSCVIPARKFCPERPLLPVLDLVFPPRGEWRLILGGTGAVYLLLAAVTGVTVFVLKKIGLPPVEQPIVQLIRQGSVFTIALLAPVMILLAPLGEELCFRYAVFKKLEYHAGPFPAALLTSLLFAAAHMNLQVFPSLFLLGLWLSTLYRRTGSLFAPVAAHALFNSVSLVLLCCMPAAK